VTATLRARAEVERLARLLGTEPEELGFLVERVEPDAIGVLRHQLTDVLFDMTSPRLEKVAGASRLLPPPLAASLAERALGPVLCAMIAGSVSPDQVVDLATRLSPEFLAQVALHLDPRIVPDVIGRLPADLVVASARELVALQEHVAMGQFASYLDESVVGAAVEAMSDDDLLRTAFVVVGDDRLRTIAAGLPDERVVGLLVAAQELGLWYEVLALVDRLGSEQAGRLGDLAIVHVPGVLDALIVFTAEEDLWDAVLPLVDHVSPENQAWLADRLAKAP
jgi:hypothetical protein